MGMGIIDFHVHYSKDYPMIVSKACIFPFTHEIYDINNPDFVDTEEWQKKRQMENEKNLGLEDRIPFLFLWTDFNISNIEQYGGIKIHRHWNEPEYDWGSEKGQLALEAIRDLNLPVIIDDVPERIIRFVKEFAIGINVVVPHLTMYPTIKGSGIYKMRNIYVDTSLTFVSYIIDYVKSFGSERIIFGTDWPFGDIQAQIRMIEIMPFAKIHKRRILEENALKVVNI
jgi:hypothetical protein